MFCFVCSVYQKKGLLIEDVIIEDPDVKQALKYLPEHERRARSKRLLRAQDLELKKKELPEELQKAHDPFRMYLSPYIKRVRDRRIEREAYGL